MNRLQLDQKVLAGLCRHHHITNHERVGKATELLKAGRRLKATNSPLIVMPLTMTTSPVPEPDPLAPAGEGSPGAQ